MTLYEYGKQLVFPNISIWSSHLITIIFGSCLATLATYHVIKCYNVLISKIRQQNEISQQLCNDLQKINANKDKFLSIMSHDLKNCVNSFYGAAELLTEHFKSSNDEIAKDISNELLKRTNYLIELLDNLLTWAQIQQGNITCSQELIDISHVFNNNSIFLFEAMSKKNISFHCLVDEGTLVYADYNMIDSIYRNLLSNAVKFTKKGGSITVASVSFDDFLEISITDTGVGMSKAKQSNIFNVRENNISSVGTEGEVGTGLGLILCNEFIQMNNGKIWVESEVDKGSKFTFTLPKSTDYLE